MFCIIDHIYFSISCLARVRANELPAPKWRLTWQTRKVGPVMKMFDSLNIEIVRRNHASCETKTLWHIVIMNFSMARIFFGKSFLKITFSLYWKKWEWFILFWLGSANTKEGIFVSLYFECIEPVDNNWVCPF